MISICILKARPLLSEHAELLGCRHLCTATCAINPIMTVLVGKTLWAGVVRPTYLQMPSQQSVACKPQGVA